MSADRPICALVAALGGQGGGVLIDWLTEAARAAGYPAQATSIPGVAQRTGATTYYFELFPERNPPAAPVFSLFPDAGDVDLVAALEPTEAARVLTRGLVSRNTTVITSTNRLYGTAEKVTAGDSRADLGQILDALTSTAKRVIDFQAATGSDGQLNAVMLGAIAGSGVLPLTEADCRAAIYTNGVAVETNLAGFEQGLAFARGPKTPSLTEWDEDYDPAPPGFEADIDAFPASLRPLIGHALARMVDYQDPPYARRYLARLQQAVEADLAGGGAALGYRLSDIVARRMAAWMSFEDAIRVAQLKTRQGRLARIRSEVGAQPGEPVDVIDYLKPARPELMSLVPKGLSWLVPGGKRLACGIPIRLRTSSPWGFALLKVLASLRRIRPMTGNFAREQRAIETWLEAVIAGARKDYEFACQTAELAIWARGYGQVRARGLAILEGIFADWSGRLDREFDAIRDGVSKSLQQARTDPDAACAPNNGSIRR
jgi:indolepyruvate ferredoxin oxidoreductase beta subunit